MRASTFLSYLFCLFFAFIAVSSALPEPVTGDGGELAARQDPSKGDGGPAKDGEELTTSDTGKGGAAMSAAAIGIAASQGPHAIGMAGTGGGAAGGDTPATGAPITKSQFDRSGMAAVWASRFIAAPFQLELK
ncbi:hypothetical protein CTheo_7212 [Ceratobasidium theobromae]|uniref:Transmembrane protein n=1 Tax=Ceratobasidium theobromae TaxID=1582974 RepID=A0A5N5QD23_9AGAM|nr:hypothetical protein CTheo_7212 [Ceratobasidium theobromae]